jgi:hypothetical protein
MDAPTPAAVVAALEQQKTLTEEEVIKVRELVQTWLKVRGAIQTTTESLDESKRKAAQDSLNSSLRQQHTELERIHHQQQLISENPFLSPDTKQALSLASMTAEYAKINVTLAENRQKLEGGVFDSQTHDRLRAEIQRDESALDSLSLKISAINKPLGAELADWVNSFGTSAHQIAGFIEGSINAALGATNQLLIDAAFRTGDWRQTVVSLEKSLLNMFLTMLEQMALQQAASLLGITTTTTAQTGSMLAIGASAAPTAAATSIATSGTAALIGEVLAIAAIVAIMAALGGGFKRGGYTGHGDEDEIAGPVHRGEFVFDKKATRSIGIERLEQLRRGAPHFSDGGPVEPDPIPGAGAGPGPLRIGDLNYPQGYQWNPHQYGTPYWSDNNRVGGSLFPGGGGTPSPSNPFLPGGRYHSSFTPYENPFAPGGRYHSSFSQDNTPAVRNAYDLWVREWMRLYGGNPNTPPVITITGPGPGFAEGIRAYYDPQTNTYVTQAGELVATYDQTTQSYVTPSGRMVAGARGPRNTGTGAGPGRPGRPGVVAPIYAPGQLRPGQYWDYGANQIRNQHQMSAREFYATLMWSQSLHQPTNLRQSDEHDRFTGDMMHRDEDGGFSLVRHLVATTMPNLSGAPALYAGPHGTIGAYNSWVMGHSQIPHGADGMRLPGAPSKTDSILAWLAPGEHVVDAYTTAQADRTYGRDWPAQLARNSVPHFASGGRAGGGSSSGTGRQPSMIKVINVIDMKSAAREALKDSDARVIIVDHVKGSAHEIGLGAVN